MTEQFVSQWADVGIYYMASHLWPSYISMSIKKEKKKIIRSPEELVIISTFWTRTPGLSY